MATTPTKPTIEVGDSPADAPVPAWPPERSASAPSARHFSTKTPLRLAELRPSGGDALQALLAFSALHQQVRQRRALASRHKGFETIAPPAEFEASEQFVLDEVLQLVAERAIAITGADGLGIALAENNEIVLRASAGTIKPDVGAAHPARLSFLGSMFPHRADHPLRRHRNRRSRKSLRLPATGRAVHGRGAAVRPAARDRIAGSLLGRAVRLQRQRCGQPGTAGGTDSWQRSSPRTKTASPNRRRSRKQQFSIAAQRSLRQTSSSGRLIKFPLPRPARDFAPAIDSVAAGAKIRSTPLPWLRPHRKSTEKARLRLRRKQCRFRCLRLPAGPAPTPAPAPAALPQLRLDPKRVVDDTIAAETCAELELRPVTIRESCWSWCWS